MTKNSMALHMAHYIYMCETRDLGLIVNKNIVTWSRALKRGWFFVDLREMMKKSVVRFMFKKKDGSIRYAKGTLHPILIPDDKKAKHDGLTQWNEQYKAIAFFDLDKQEWRSFNIHDFIGFVEIWQIVRIAKTV